MQIYDSELSYLADVTLTADCKPQKLILWRLFHNAG